MHEAVWNQEFKPSQPWAGEQSPYTNADILSQSCCNVPASGSGL